MYFLHEEDINFCFRGKCCNHAQLSNSNGWGRGRLSPKVLQTGNMGNMGQARCHSSRKGHSTSTSLSDPTSPLRGRTHCLFMSLLQVPRVSAAATDLQHQPCQVTPALQTLVRDPVPPPWDAQGCQPTEGPRVACSAHRQGRVSQGHCGWSAHPSSQEMGPSMTSMAVCAHGSCLLTELCPSATPDNLVVLWAAAAWERPN